MIVYLFILTEILEVDKLQFEVSMRGETKAVYDELKVVKGEELVLRCRVNFLFTKENPRWEQNYLPCGKEEDKETSNNPCWSSKLKCSHNGAQFYNS